MHLFYKSHTYFGNCTLQTAQFKAVEYPVICSLSNFHASTFVLVGRKNNNVTYITQICYECTARWSAIRLSLSNTELLTSFYRAA